MRVPNVSLVSSVPSERLICDAKKFPTGLFGPDKGKSPDVVLPKYILSPAMTASPSCADTKSLPVIGSDEGVLNPVSETSVLPAVRETTVPPPHSVKFRKGCDAFS